MFLKKLQLSFLLFLTFSFTYAQQPYFNKDYTFKKSSSVLQDKNFYLLTLLETSPDVFLIFENDPSLSRLHKDRMMRFKKSEAACKDSVSCHTQNIYWTEAEIDQVSSRFRELFKKHQAVRDLVKAQMRPSGYFALYDQLPDQEVFVQSWKDAALGMNYILKAYTLNKDLRYPKADSVAYAVSSPYYRNLVKELFAQVESKSDGIKLFFQLNLQVTLQLLFINEREEAAWYEPLNAGENRKAYDQVAKINWSKYAYPVILIPGEGPENQMAISPNTKYRCEMGAERYKRGLAPFVIVSGGHVHPAHTLYCEAIEMKKYLMEKCALPEEAIIIEPHARHTTTNFRNASRIMARAGIPTDRKSLVTTSILQADYIISENFKTVNMKYLKYLPFLDLKRLNKFDIEFVPNLQSLHMDSLDPLDP